MNSPLLSVCLITYNHAKFIRKAIDGVLMQKVNFSCELIIADDCSTDGTREILLEYEAAYPEYIKLIMQSTNVGPAKNWFDLISAPKSKYIAYIEGDDYWTDSLKLQKQVDFLENNSEYSASVHSIACFDQNLNIFIASKFENINRDFDLNFFKILKEGGGVYPSCSLVMKNELIKYPDELKDFSGGDWVLIIFLSLSGKVKFMKDKMAVYRIHSSGAYQGHYKDKKFIIKNRNEHYILFLTLFKYIDLKRKIVLLLFIIWNQISILYIRLKL